MANVSRISGLAPVSYLNGSPWNGQARTYYVPSTDTLAYAIGDPVDYAGSADARGVPSITLATAGNNSGANRILGVVVGVLGSVYGSSAAGIVNPNTIVAPATKTVAYYLEVADDPNIVFQIQEGGTGTALTAAEVGLNVDLASGTNNGYVSGWIIDNAATSTSANFQLSLLGLAQKSDNAFGAYAKWLVKINLHRRAASTAGV